MAMARPPGVTAARGSTAPAPLASLAAFSNRCAYTRSVEPGNGRTKYRASMSSAIDGHPVRLLCRAQNDLRPRPFLSELLLWSTCVSGIVDDARVHPRREGD